MDAGLLVIVGLFVLFWLLLIRPQRRRQRAQQEMISNLRVGDEIVTAGGLYGDVIELAQDEVLVEIAEGVEVRVARRAVAGVMPDEDEEELEEEQADEGEPEPEAPSKTGDES
jgi:preprotein translocase subunit YajC